ncbi:MAG: oligosaccharide flippase family protein [Bacteroidales bacterium]|nr:oligosaccharide flippase family protein [Bacteroidales bacterium]MDY0315746.1 oligosaccharide flippase family protein [Bacteroidales bacterium]
MNITTLKKLFTTYSKNQKVKQVALLYGVNLIGIPLGIVTSIIITRYLGAEVYGDYKFLNSIFSLAILIFSFGIFQAGNRALVLNDDKETAREYYGAELILVVVLFLIMSVFLLAYGLFDSNLNEKGLSSFFIKLIPFGWIFILVRYFEVLFQADNRIKLLALTRFWPKVGFLVAALAIYFLFLDYSGNRLALIWFLFLFTQAVVFVNVIWKIKPSFKNLKKRVKEIWGYNKSFGLQVYFGSLMAVGFAQLTGILISYFGMDNTGVGYYSLALTFAAPLALIPNVIATTHYKDFSTKKRIPTKLFIITLGLSLAALIALWLIISPFIRYFYGVEFEPVIRLNLIVSTGVALHGLADFINRFLGAHGQGKALRNASFFVGISLMTLNLILIPKFGATGAAFTKFASGIIYILIIYLYYLNLRKKLNYSE